MPLIDTSTDAALILASASDSSAFTGIFDRYWVAIYRYCVGRAGPPGEDLAAETFRVAFDQRRGYDGRDDAGPWLYGIATNLVRRWFRSVTRGARASQRIGGETAPNEPDETLDRLEAAHLGPRLAACLGELAAVDRDALLLHALAELTYEQIARATGVPVGTVRSRIHRARGRVRAHLEALEACR